MTTYSAFLISIGKSEKTAKNYAGAIKGVMSKWAAQEGWVIESLLEIENPLQFEAIALKLHQLPIYIERNTVGKGMYNAALNGYADFLAQEKGVYLERDLANILTDDSISSTEKKTLINTRIGQGGYRQALIDYWGGCAATGYKLTQLLVASHIKPWRSSEPSERLDKFNGLLLLPSIDKAFDIGYISFKENGNVCISEELENPALLGVHSTLKVKLSTEHQNYMDYHRGVVFRN